MSDFINRDICHSLDVQQYQALVRCPCLSPQCRRQYRCQVLHWLRETQACNLQMVERSEENEHAAVRLRQSVFGRFFHLPRSIRQSSLSCYSTAERWHCLGRTQTISPILCSSSPDVLVSRTWNMDRRRYRGEGTEAMLARRSSNTTTEQLGSGLACLQSKLNVSDTTTTLSLTSNHHLPVSVKPLLPQRRFIKTSTTTRYRADRCAAKNRSSSAHLPQPPLSTFKTGWLEIASSAAQKVGTTTLTQRVILRATCPRRRPLPGSYCPPRPLGPLMLRGTEKRRHARQQAVLPKDRTVV